jgi:hypothetical protein
MQEQKLIEGPLGFPLTTRQAIAVDQTLKPLPQDRWTGPNTQECQYTTSHDGVQ